MNCREILKKKIKNLQLIKWFNANANAMTVRDASALATPSRLTPTVLNMTRVTTRISLLERLLNLEKRRNLESPLLKNK
jgi:uncharacterized lipoprotein YddW (UPF0748 family)